LSMTGKSMPAEGYLLTVIQGERGGSAASLLRAGLSVLSFIYNAGLKLFLLPYRLGLRKQLRLPCPVVSIGNLTVGGTGKTPMTQWLCEQLLQRGLKVCVLSRGYRGGKEHSVAIVSDGKRTLLDAGTAGDEAFMLAGLLPGVPILVGKDRRESGSLAVERFHPDVIVLDDGMQFYQLYRDVDVVLVDARRPFDNGWTFPRGLLREPPSHIRRASCVIFTHADRADAASLQALQDRVRDLAPLLPTYTATHQMSCFRALDRSSEHPPTWPKDRRIGALCGLGSPASFREQLEQAGAKIVHWKEFPDHHEPTMGELNEFITSACGSEAEAIVVTDKDAVKLPPLMRPLPFYALEMRISVSDEAEFLDHVLRALNSTDPIGQAGPTNQDAHL
jgi:tetraacyldisaccharide 4''-kinase